MINQVVKQVVIVPAANNNPTMVAERIAIFDDAGDPVDLAALQTGEDIPLTGYDTVAADDVEATDTVNEGIGKLEARIALGEVLTGYEIGEIGALAATDTINEAFGKLEARLAAVEAELGA